MQHGVLLFWSHLLPQLPQHPPDAAAPDSAPRTADPSQSVKLLIDSSCRPIQGTLQESNVLCSVAFLRRMRTHRERGHGTTLTVPCIRRMDPGGVGCQFREVFVFGWGWKEG